MNIFSFYGYWQFDLIHLFNQGAVLPFESKDVFQFLVTYLALPFLIIGNYFFITFFRLLLNKRKSRQLALYYFSGQLFVFIITGMILYTRAGQEVIPQSELKKYIENIYIVIDIGIVAYALSQYFVHRNGLENQARKKLAKSLSLIYLVIVLPNYMLFFVYDGPGLIYMIHMVMIHMIDLPPLVFLGVFLRKNKMYAFPDGYTDWIACYGITNREHEIIQFISEGKTNQEIADTLYISLQTVKDHIYNIFRKTGMKNRVQLINSMGKFKQPERNI
jgi:DNA-binding CsgD family transcriptional regulator